MGPLLCNIWLPGFSESPPDPDRLKQGLDPSNQPHPRGLNEHLVAKCFEIFQMKRAVSGSGLLLSGWWRRQLLDNQGTQLPLCLKGVPGSQEEWPSALLYLPWVPMGFLLLFAIFSL